VVSGQWSVVRRRRAEDAEGFVFFPHREMTMGKNDQPSRAKK